MDNYDNAYVRIKSLECPTGDLQERIQEILSIYDVADKNDIIITREKSSDHDGMQAFRIDFANEKEQSKIVLAKSGAEDYVSKVFDVIDY